jgi:hypothetical protein
MANWVTYTITVENKYKYLVDDNKKHVYWLKDDAGVYSLDGKTKYGFLKWYKDNWYEIKGLSYLAYVEK